MPRRSAATDRPGLPPEAELELLACLHELGEATAAEVRESLAPVRPMTHPSVATLLQRLEERGLVTRSKAPVGKAFLYRPTAGSEATFGRAASRLVRRVFGGDSAGLVASLFGAHRPTREELAGLKDLVDRMWAEAGEEEKG